MKKIASALLVMQLLSSPIISQTAPQVRIANGLIEGVTETSGIRSFKGIPFAQPPVGDLRWKEPQAVANWSGVRKTDRFGNNPMQKPVFGDMGFRSAGMSEDCLFLNVWAPATPGKEKLPVLVYFYGGGLVAGDGSEARYDGEAMAKQGIVALTVNYRLGVFGFLAHPELTKESPHHSSSNYGYLDQNAALKWVQENIAAFGGDPKRVTIAGESAGSISVSVQMASPLSRNLIAGAIGESGAAINPTLAPVPLAEGEKNGIAFAQKMKTSSIAQLRAIPAAQLLDSAGGFGPIPMSATIDGYILPKSLPEIFKAGEQAQVPLMVGWNSAEIPHQSILRADPPTPENYQKALQALYADKAAEVLQLYPGGTQEEVIRSATALASDRFIVYSTWKWADLHNQYSNKPVYRYLFSKIKPPASAAPQRGGAPVGASHASEIEYAMGNLLTNNNKHPWTADDHKVSATMFTYFANFIKNGNPNGKTVPEWPANTKDTPVKFINIDTNTKAENEQDRSRYIFLDKIYMK